MQPEQSVTNVTNQRRTVLPLTILWFALATWQYARSATICTSGSSMTFVYWLLLLAALGVPLILIVRGLGEPASGSAPPGTRLLTFALSTYVPCTLALRLIEACASR